MNALDVAEAAVAAAPGDALAHVSRERSLMLRFARNAPTQATAIDDVTVELAMIVDGQLGRATTNAADPASLAACAERAACRRQGGRSNRGAGDPPRLSRAGPARAHHGHDPDTAALDPAPGGAALAAAFAAAERHGVEAHGIWTVAEDERAVATRDGGVIDRTTDAYMKVICIAPDGRSGYASSVAVAASKVARRAARRAGDREGARARCARRAAAR